VSNAANALSAINKMKDPRGKSATRKAGDVSSSVTSDNVFR